METVIRSIHTNNGRLSHNPVHLIMVFPLGFLAASLILDIIYLGTGDGEWTNAAEYLIGCGVVINLILAIIWLREWVAIPYGSHAKTVGLWHGLANAAVTILFIIDMCLRLPAPSETGASPIILSFIGVAVALANLAEA